MQGVLTSCLLLVAAVGAMPAKPIPARAASMHQLSRAGHTTDDDGPPPCWHKRDTEAVSALHSSRTAKDQSIQSRQGPWTRCGSDGTEGSKSIGRSGIIAGDDNAPRGLWKRGDEPADSNLPKETWKRSDRTMGADLPHATWKRGSVAADGGLPKNNWKRGEQPTGGDGPHGTWKRDDAINGVGGPRGGWKRDGGAA